MLAAAEGRTEGAHSLMMVTTEPAGAKDFKPACRYPMSPHQPATTTLRGLSGSGSTEEFLHRWNDRVRTCSRDALLHVSGWAYIAMQRQLLPGTPALENKARLAGVSPPCSIYKKLERPVLVGPEHACGNSVNSM